MRMVELKQQRSNLWYAKGVAAEGYTEWVRQGRTGGRTLDQGDPKCAAANMCVCERGENV